MVLGARASMGAGEPELQDAVHDEQQASNRESARRAHGGAGSSPPRGQREAGRGAEHRLRLRCCPNMRLGILFHVTSPDPTPLPSQPISTRTTRSSPVTRLGARDAVRLVVRRAMAAAPTVRGYGPATSSSLVSGTAQAAAADAGVVRACDDAAGVVDAPARGGRGRARRPAATTARASA
ncbi:hypothetical protein U9M48_029069 [Paspalum notatum var. saurae]|uniref:Uncharacterized protein n=1 Tax=Paspalum notatum var. saurae TaxID=547442 RepID=A0AAQ3X1N0_PASNO